MIAVFAFIFGGFSFLLSGGCDEFQDGGWAWVALACDFTIVALNSFALVRTFWQVPA